MRIVGNIFLIIFCIIFGMGVIGERDKEKNKRYAYILMISIAGLAISLLKC